MGVVVGGREMGQAGKTLGVLGHEGWGKGGRPSKKVRFILSKC